MRYSASLAVTALMASALPALATPNLVSDGGFEAGNFTPWTTGGDTSALTIETQNAQNALQAHSGDWYAVFGSNDASSITQIITGGFQSYDLNFWAAGAGLTVLWDEKIVSGTENGVGAGGGGGDGVVDGVATQNGFQNYTYLLPGSFEGSHRLTFRHLGMPAAFGYIPRLDTISLAGVEVVNVPEPPAIALLGIGLLGMTAALYRKKNRARGLVPTGSLDPNKVRLGLQRHEGLLRRAGVEKLTFAGSVARGQGKALSDVDVVATFRDGLNLRHLRDLVKLTILERHLSHAVGRSVDMLPDDSLAPHVRATTSRDAIQVF